MTYSLYLHIPFCMHRCGYCDFNTYAGLESLIPAYTNALVQEIRQAAGQAAGQPDSATAAHRPVAQQPSDGQPAAYPAAHLPQVEHSALLQRSPQVQRSPQRLPAHTVFFGGGTPSLLPADALALILEALRETFALDPQAEISLEANPGTLSLEYLQALRALGVNRLSLGVQSANPNELRLLERQHDYPDVIRSVTWARQAGFDNLSLDLIFGLPEQSLTSWQRSLALALDLQPEHLSLYALTMEHGTPFGHWARRGLLSSPDPDAAAEMYEWAADRLAQKGYAQYEISNWARVEPKHLDSSAVDSPTRACRHNLQYWRNLPYLGLGAGAHGYAAGRRTVNTLSPQAYIQRLSAPWPPAAAALAGRPPFPFTAATQSAQEIDRAAEIGETMMMGLRMVREGVSNSTFQARFGQSLQDVFPAQIARLQRQGLLEWAGTQDERLRLTQRACLLANRVFVEFI